MPNGNAFITTTHCPQGNTSLMTTRYSHGNASLMTTRCSQGNTLLTRQHVSHDDTLVSHGQHEYARAYYQRTCIMWSTSTHLNCPHDRHQYDQIPGITYSVTIGSSAVKTYRRSIGSRWVQHTTQRTHRRFIREPLVTSSPAHAPSSPVVANIGTVYVLINTDKPTAHTRTVVFR